MSTPAADDWRSLYAFGWPAGSVRAVLALMLFGAAWAWLLLRPAVDVPDYLENLLFIIMGHYFAARKDTGVTEEPGPPPLYLPRGAVRWTLVAGFAIVTVLLLRQDRLAWPAEGAPVHRGISTLLLVAGFLVGVAVSRFWNWWSARRYPPRWLENLRATVSLAAAALLVLVAFDLIELPDWTVVQHVKQLGSRAVGSILAAIVGFYFGSRS